MSRFRGAALRRSVLAAFVLFSVLAGRPAGATSIECDQAWEQFATVVRQEARRGLTMERLEQINEYIPIVEACAEGSVGEWGSGVDRWGPLVASYFRPEDVARALCLMELESAGDPGARNPASGATGLMQVMPFWAGHFGYSTSDLFNPWTNLEVAAAIREQQGWEAWSPYIRGMCR
ncbi:MAG: transglycosylase SLT domain-containing protein [Acidimicrobiia bacterium]